MFIELSRILEIMVKILLKVLPFLIVAVTTYFLGVRSYFKQREYESVRKRYLEESIDQICCNLNFILGVHRSNWSKCLGNLKLLRDMGDNSSVDSFVFDIEQVDQGLLNLNAFMRLKSLIDNDIFWIISQSAFAFVGNYNVFIENEIYPIIRLFYADPSKINGDNRDIYDLSFEEMMKKKDEDKQYYKLLAYLHTLSRILEKEKLTFKDIDNFSKRKDIKELVKHAENDFSKIKDIKFDSIESKIKKVPK